MSMAAAPNADYSVTVRLQLKSAMEQRWVALWNKSVLLALGAFDQRGKSVFQTVRGGKNGEFFALTPLENMASLDGPGPLSSMTPAEGAALTAQVSELLEECETNVTRTDHELSFGLPGLQPLTNLDSDVDKNRAE